jgi:hypothetical protein
MGFIAALKTYFGMLPNQTLQDFSKEIKNLTIEDKKELHHLLVTQASIQCDPPLDANVS